MPKIPTFTTQARPTAEVGAVKSNIQIPLSQNIGTALAPVTDAIVKNKIKEETINANNEATKILADLYIDQKDVNGNVIQKGLFSIQSEAAAKSNPSNAAQGFDEGINTLWGYTQSNKLKNSNKFLRKAIENKFTATSSMFKITALESSRAEQIKETTKVTNNFIVADSFALKKNGLSYMSAYKNNVVDSVNKLINLDSGVKKTLTKNYIAFGQKQLATDLALNSPEFLKENINKFDFIELEDKLEIITTADKSILANNTAFFTSGLQLTENTTAKNILEEYEGIKKQTFNGDIDKINKWKKLSTSDKTTILTEAKKIRRANTSELNNRNTAILNEQKDESINKYRSFYSSSKSLQTLDLLKINKVFGEPRNDYEKNAKSQIVELSTKIGEKEFSNKNNYYKNFNIQKEILSGQIKDHITPFILSGETEAKSLTERVGSGISKSEFGFYLNYLLPNIENENFTRDHKKLYNRIESLQAFVEGPSSLKYLDTTLDNRLNNFQSSMLANFAQGLKNFVNVDEMLDPKNKNFIGKEWKTFQPDKDYITKILSEKAAESVKTDELLPPHWNPNKYKTVDDWLNSAEYKKYEIKKKTQ